MKKNKKTYFNVYDFIKGKDKEVNYTDYTNEIHSVNAQLSFELDKKITCLVGDAGSGKTYHIKKFSHNHPVYNYIYIGENFSDIVPPNVFIDEKGDVHNLQHNTVKAKSHLDFESESSSAVIFNNFYNSLDLALSYINEDKINVFIVEDIRPRTVIEHILRYILPKVKDSDRFIVTAQPLEAFPKKYSNLSSFNDCEVYIDGQKINNYQSVFAFSESNTNAYITYRNVYQDLKYLIPMDLSKIDKLK